MELQLSVDTSEIRCDGWPVAEIGCQTVNADELLSRLEWERQHDANTTIGRRKDGSRIRDYRRFPVPKDTAQLIHSYRNGKWRAKSKTTSK